jgi:serine/threonine protein phosphatase 1
MVYVSSDWHGTSPDKIKALLTLVNFGSNDVLYVLGDVIDRGEYGVELLKFIMRNPNIKLLRGNHEQMLLDCGFLFDDSIDSLNDLNALETRRLRIWKSNGANVTIEKMYMESARTRKAILEYLYETPIYDLVTLGEKKFLLVHAGLGESKNVSLDELAEYPERDFLWTRPTLSTMYSTDFFTVFGHTPTCFYGEEYIGTMIKKETWINVDVGAGKGLNPAILRLDDMKEFYLNGIFEEQS